MSETPPRARPPAARRTRPQGAAALVALPVFLGVVLFSVLVWRVTPWTLAAYGVMSVVCFAAYASDKSSAMAGRRRISENTLLGLGLLCGWPGGLVAQQLLRHKSSKASFLRSFWFTVAVNVVAFVWLCSRGVMPSAS